MTHNVVILCDSDEDRAVVVRALIETLGVDVEVCLSAAECMDWLAAHITPPRLILAHVQPDATPLLPALRHWREEQMRRLPSLLLWSRNGLRDVAQHARFIERERALVFSLPLDVDLLVATTRKLLAPSHALAVAYHAGPARHCDAFWRGRRKPQHVALARRRVRR